MKIYIGNKEKELVMQNPPGFTQKASDDGANKDKEDANINHKGDKNADGSNLIVEEDDEELVPTPDFYDFERGTTEKCFAVDQIWAIYDNYMPRRYVQINKVYSPFKVAFTWLEFSTRDMYEADWKRNGLPVACGKFTYGQNGEIKDIRSFSHKVFEQISKTSYNIHPQEGETWALYKNWNIKWSSDPDNHREYEYEFVLVRSDYTKKSGVWVTNLAKLKGFVCLFKPTKNNGSFKISSNEMLRFSHRVPSCKTTGRERKDVPEGYFELDTRSLPSNLEELCESVDGSTSGLSNSASKEKHLMQKKRKSPEAESTLNRSSSGVYKSYRMSSRCNKNSNENKQAAEASDRSLYKITPTSVSNGKKNVAAHAKEISPEVAITIHGSVDGNIPSSSKTFEMPDTIFCNFQEFRSSENFKSGQIWALYCNLDKLPKIYAQIESFESAPVFKLTVKWLKSCEQPRGVVPWVDKEMPVSCGKFEVTSSEVSVFSDSVAFSHQLIEVPAVTNGYVIHPRAREVWALYSKFRSDLMCSDLKNCEYDLVQILKVVDVNWIIVSVLERVTDFKTVFRAKERDRLDSIVAIPWIELNRFSHQVPAFILSEASYGKLHGCLELDPRSIAVY